MSITIGNDSTSGDPGSPNTTYSWSHECATGSNLLVVATRARDSVAVDADVTGITYDGNPLDPAVEYYDGVPDLGCGVWYLVSPTTEASLTIEVTHGGKCSDASAGAIDFGGVDTADPLDDTDSKTRTAGGTGSLLVNPAASGSVLVGSATLDDSSVDNLSVSEGTEIDEVDMGSYVGGSARNSESGGTATITWVKTIGQAVAIAGATFNPAAVEVFPPVPGRVHRDRRSPLLRM